MTRSLESLEHTLQFIGRANQGAPFEFIRKTFHAVSIANAKAQASYLFVDATMFNLEQADGSLQPI